MVFYYDILISEHTSGRELYSMKDNESKTSLHRGLKSRHMQMIALGASVGTGLFYGSAPTIQLVGPGVIFSYLLTGIFIFFFNAYARRNVSS